MHTKNSTSNYISRSLVKSEIKIKTDNKYILYIGFYKVSLKNILNVKLIWEMV